MLLEGEDSTLSSFFHAIITHHSELSVLSNIFILLQILPLFLYLYILPLSFHAVLYNGCLKSLSLLYRLFNFWQA